MVWVCEDNHQNGAPLAVEPRRGLVDSPKGGQALLPSWWCHALCVSAAMLIAPGCGSSLKTSTPPQAVASTGLSRNTRAVLDVIAYAEGTGARYDIIFSYKTFSSYADHPRRVVCSGGYCSDAAGRYQFLSTTWDETRAAIKLKDFSPANQDLGATDRIEVFRGAREHGMQLSRSQFERLVYKLNEEWASLPGSPYGQPTRSLSELWTVYQESLAQRGGARQ